MIETRPLISGGKVTNIIEYDTEGTWLPPPGVTLGPAGGRHGQLYDAGTQTYSDPPPPEITTDDLIHHAVEKRRNLTNGSTIIDLGERSIQVWVDPESRGSLMGLHMATLLDAELTASWKGADSQFYTLNAAEITTMALGVMSFIQQCFNIEETALSGIANETITSIEQIDELDWPE